ncbi:hypothetical protein TI04_01705 [Achromatium sp. WMS2]|nr:hypothetical protein TI04_01705 [Achromatium sp. WMS2]
MRKLIIAAIFFCLPLTSMAKDAVAPDTGPTMTLNRILLISAGVIGGVFLADFLIGGSLTAPVVHMMSPAMQQARNAGAVFGEQVAAATAIRDNQARASMVHAILVVSGALLGGWAVDQFVIKQLEPDPVGL